MAVDNASILLNNSLNETINQSLQSPLASSINYVDQTLFPRITDLLIAPSKNPDMIWILTPMIIALVLMQLYFGRNKDEALGWNTAFGNSIALIFISVSLLRELFLVADTKILSEFLFNALILTEIKIIIVLAIFIYALVLALISFFHWIPQKIAFFIMNSISINVTAYVAIVLVNSTNIPLDRHTLLAGFLIFIVVYLITATLRVFIPASVVSKIHLLEHKKKILESRIKTFEKTALKTKYSSRQERLNKRAVRYKNKISEIDEEIDELKKD